MSNLEQLRKDYESRGIADSELDSDPFRQFQLWFEEARSTCSADWFEPNAMTLSTAEPSGRVTSRTVLLKHFDQQGFTFFTNYESEKGEQIAANPQVCLLFHWPYQGRQIRIDGTAARTTRAMSDSYFHSRPRPSQIAACISRQSRVAPPRDELDRLYAGLAERLSGKPVPTPEHWGGYLVTPNRFEFWQGRSDRLHDRFRYQLQSSGLWQMDRLYP
jgi:pyridoxamine 5'-phosphate oxidase